MGVVGYRSRLEILLKRKKANRSLSEQERTLTREEGWLTLTTKPGNGKITDTGYDKLMAWYTRVPADREISLSADIRVLSFLERDHVTYQEGFGAFLRDTMESDLKTGYPYSNMAFAGGYYGRWNVFVRTGVEKTDKERIRNTYLYEKAGDPELFRTEEGAPRRFSLRIDRRKDGIWASMKDVSGREVLGEEGVFIPLAPESFSLRDRRFFYVGFFAAGASVSVNMNSVRLSVRGAAAPGDRKIVRPGRELFAAPSGSASGDGTAERPYDLRTAVRFCLGGERIIARPGVYRLGEDLILPRTRSGAPDYPRTILCPEPGRAVLDFGGSDAALILEGDHWVLDGLAVVHGMGLQIRGSHNLVRNCFAARNGETGILIRHERNDSPREEWPAFNLVEDCVSFENRDRNECNADGFACKVAAGEGNRFVRCLSYLNADDGFDLFSKNRRIGAVELTDCRSCLNGFKRDGERLVKTSGNGVGFKLGGSGLDVAHSASGCEAFGNKGSGFSSNSNPRMELTDCRAGGNGEANFRFYFTGRKASVKKRIKRCKEENQTAFDSISWLARQKDGELWLLDSSGDE